MNTKGNGDDSDYEEEESLVLVELSGIIEAGLLPKVQECKVLGIDTEQPLLQLDNYVFQGEYEDPMGTSLLFEEKMLPDTAVSDSEAEKQLDFKHLSSKKLCMQRVFIKKNKHTLGADQEGGDSTSEQMEMGNSSSTIPSHPLNGSVAPQPRSSQSKANPDISAIQPGIISQAGSDSSLAIPVESGDILQTCSSYISESLQTGSNASNADKIAQSEISAYTTDTSHVDKDSVSVEPDEQTYTVEVYAGMDSGDTAESEQSDSNSAVIESTDSKEVWEPKGQPDTEEKPNG